MMRMGLMVLAAATVGCAMAAEPAATRLSFALVEW